MKKLAEEIYSSRYFFGATQLVGLALVTVACLFLSNDASDSKHLKTKRVGPNATRHDQVQADPRQDGTSKKIAIMHEIGYSKN